MSGDARPIRIAALILAHHRPDLAERLLDRLSGPLWDRHLHLDAKTDDAPWAKLRERARFLERRTGVYWGCVSTIDATLDLMRAGLAEPSNTHLYLISGQCWPIKSDAEIEAVLQAPGVRGDFLETVKMPVWHKPMNRLTHWHFNRMPYAVACRFNRVLNWFAPRRSVAKLLRGTEPWGGSQWWLLSRATAQALVDFVDANPWYRRAFDFSLLSDEMFFQTAAKHLGVEPERATPTATRWIAGNRSPQLLGPADLAELAKDWHLFARKVNETAFGD